LSAAAWDALHCTACLISSSGYTAPAVRASSASCKQRRRRQQGGSKQQVASIQPARKRSGGGSREAGCRAHAAVFQAPFFCSARRSLPLRHCHSNSLSFPKLVPILRMAFASANSSFVRAGHHHQPLAATSQQHALSSSGCAHGACIGEYELHACIGRGSYAECFRARCLRCDEWLCVKRLDKGDILRRKHVMYGRTAVFVRSAKKCDTLLACTCGGRSRRTRNCGTLASCA
jgi:hypothetical protein